MRSIDSLSATAIALATIKPDEVVVVIIPTLWLSMNASKVDIFDSSDSFASPAFFSVYEADMIVCCNWDVFSRPFSCTPRL